MQKKIQVLADPVVVNFIEMYLIQHLYFLSFKSFKENTSVGFNWCSDPTLVFFLTDFFFEFPKKITSVESSTFQKNLQRLDLPTLVTCNFFCILEKKYNDWIKSFSKSKWTGLYATLTQHYLGQIC